jgi:arginine N-succinyltransferase
MDIGDERVDQGDFVIRPVRASDFDWLYEISNLVGIGFTSLPHDKVYIARRLEIVEKSFQETIPAEERIYLFVRENLPSGERIGLCGIHDDVGYKDAFYNYQVSTVTQLSKEQNIFIEHKLINVVNNFQTASELISFWMHPTHRGQNLSKSLALSRFLFIAHYPQWFGEEIIAEVRGVCDENGNSPFWEAIGRRFFGMDFKQADALTMTQGKQYIADLVSREPIYLDLLPIEAQKVVGVAHPTAEVAKHFLEEQGFKYNNYIDIFDAGPLLNAERDKIKSVVNSKLVRIGKCVDKQNEGERAMIYNARLDVRITVGKILVIGTDEVQISNRVAKLLNVTVNDTIRYCLL